MTDISKALRTAIINDPIIAPLLSTYRGEPAMILRHPAPTDATFPYVLSGSDITVTDNDFIDDEKPVIIRQISVYGEQKAHFRVVEQIARRLRVLFHRKPKSIFIDGYHVIEITVEGPFDAPISDDQNTGKAIRLTVRVQPTTS